jgi:hypothetical protein
MYESLACVRSFTLRAYSHRRIALRIYTGRAVISHKSYEHRIVLIKLPDFPRLEPCLPLTRFSEPFRLTDVHSRQILFTRERDREGLHIAMDIRRGVTWCEIWVSNVLPTLRSEVSLSFSLAIRNFVICTPLLCYLMCSQGPIHNPNILVFSSAHSL